MFDINQYGANAKIYLLMQAWENNQDQQNLFPFDCDINYYQIKIDNWKTNLKEIENKIDSIADVNLWNLLIKFLKKQNLDVLYENLNSIHQEVKNAIDNYVCIMADQKEDNFLYLSPLLEIIVDVQMLMNKLYKKDVQLFLMKQNSDSSPQRMF